MSKERCTGGCRESGKNQGGSMTSKHLSNLPQSEGPRALSRKVTIPFNEITESGAYYCHDTGWLYRVPDEGVSLGHSPTMNIVSRDENIVTRIAEDPWIPLNKAREICSNLDLAVNF